MSERELFLCVGRAYILKKHGIIKKKRPSSRRVEKNRVLFLLLFDLRVPSSMSMFMSHSLGMPVSRRGGSKKFSSISSSSSSSKGVVVSKSSWFFCPSHRRRPNRRAVVKKRLSSRLLSKPLRWRAEQYAFADDDLFQFEDDDDVVRRHAPSLLLDVAAQQRRQSVDVDIWKTRETTPTFVCFPRKPKGFLKRRNKRRIK